MSTNEIRAALRRMKQITSGEEEENPRPKIAILGEIANLRAALGAYETHHDFVAGDLVRQKDACRIYDDSISDNRIAIVVEVYPRPRTIATTPDCYPVTMTIGEWDVSDGTFVFFQVDGARYEPFYAEDLG